jgi:7,8-dihydropterin-6-yl-methyl-4-(beta-D-ribofuranosyl)aminobenzene 5'-phosphate synthase
MKAKVLCAYEEGSLVNTPLIGAEGLSLIVEADDLRILFDTGRKGKYLMHNLGHLDISPESVSRVVISHGHGDHTGGLDTFLKERETPVTVSAHAECLRIMESRKVIGEENVAMMNAEEIEGWTQLSDHLFAAELPAAEVRKKFGGSETVYETALVLMTRSGPVLITGCAHAGLAEAIGMVRRITGKDVHAVVGGVHLAGKRNSELDAIASFLTDDIRTPLLYLNHCATPKSKTQLRTRLGLKGVRDFYVGNEAVFDV